MQHQLILVVGLLLTSCLPAEAQTLTTQVLLGPALPEPTPMLAPASLNDFPSKVSPTSRPPQKPVARFKLLVIPAYAPDRNLESRSPVEEFRTPFLTESRLVVV